jgi:hypothetical protein
MACAFRISRGLHRAVVSCGCLAAMSSRWILASSRRRELDDRQPFAAEEMPAVVDCWEDLFWRNKAWGICNLAPREEEVSLRTVHSSSKNPVFWFVGVGLTLRFALLAIINAFGVGFGVGFGSTVEEEWNFMRFKQCHFRCRSNEILNRFGFARWF